MRLGEILKESKQTNKQTKRSTERYSSMEEAFRMRYRPGDLSFFSLPLVDLGIL